LGFPDWFQPLWWKKSGNLLKMVDVVAKKMKQPVSQGHPSIHVDVRVHRMHMLQGLRQLATEGSRVASEANVHNFV